MMIPLDDYYDELVELIYQMPLDTTAWAKFAKKLIEILDASYVHIQAIDFNYNVLSFSNGVGKMPIEAYACAELDYLRYPTEADPRWEKFLDPKRQGWYQCHTHVSEDFVQQSDLYQKILLPFGLRFVATHELIWDDKLCVFWSVTTTVERQPLNQDKLAFLDRLLPHLKRVVMAQRHLYEFSLDNIVGYNLIDKLSQPIILLNLSGQVVHYNQAAQLFLQHNLDIKIEQNKLILLKMYQSIFEENLYRIEDAFRYKQQQLEQLKDLNIEMVDKIIKINLLASEKEQSFFGIRPLLMLTLEQQLQTGRASDYVLCAEDLKQLYKLTKRELELCELLMGGMNVKEIAGYMTLTENTVRTYLRSIFEKTTCKSQVALIQLLIKTCANGQKS